MSEAVYRNIDIPLDAITSENQREVALAPGTTIYGATVVSNNFSDTPLPAGAELKLYFGQGADEILLSDDLVSFEFPCGHADGIFFSNGVVAVGKKVRLLVDFTGGGGMVQYAR